MLCAANRGMRVQEWCRLRPSGFVCLMRYVLDSLFDLEKEAPKRLGSGAMYREPKIVCVDLRLFGAS